MPHFNLLVLKLPGSYMQDFTVLLALEWKGKLLHHIGISQVRHQLFVSSAAMVPDRSSVVNGMKRKQD